MDKKVIIATHDGMFHSDDVFAVAALLCLLDSAPAVTNIVRTRDEDVIRKADFVVDVGCEYDSEKNCFDHHQSGGAGKRQNGISDIAYAAFGLVWLKFGRNIAGSKEVAELVDRNLVASIDANDNGMDLYKKTLNDVAPYLIDDYLHNIRPTWQESIETLDTRFLEAVSVARQVLKREIVHAQAQAAAEVLVHKAYHEAADKRLIVLDGFYPHEKALAVFKEPLFSIFPRLDGSWSVKAIRDDTTLFKNRVNLPASWAGKRDRELAEITGVPDALFCHNGRFMAAAKTKEGAFRLAKLALEM